MRHGQSTANEKQEIATGLIPLTKKGLKQAQTTAKNVKLLDIVTIATSPLVRAQQTAEIIAAELGIDIAHIKVIDELKERDLGKLEGKPKRHESSYYYTVDNEHKIESLKDITKRMKRCLHKIKILAEEGTVLVVGHAVSGYYLLELSEGRENYLQFEPPKVIMNADFVVVDLTKHKLRAVG